MKELFTMLAVNKRGRRTVLSNLFALQLIQLVSLAKFCEDGKCEFKKEDEDDADSVKNWTIPGIVISIVVLILIGFCVYYQFCEGRCGRRQ